MKREGQGSEGDGEGLAADHSVSEGFGGIEGGGNTQAPVATESPAKTCGFV